jgi:hypothetical protein
MTNLAGGSTKWPTQAGRTSIRSTFSGMTGKKMPAPRMRSRSSLVSAYPAIRSLLTWERERASSHSLPLECVLVSWLSKCLL